MSKLSERKIQGLRAPGRYSDGAGLHLHVRAGGSRTWVLRKMLGGRQTDFFPGPHPDLSLADAREKARKWRRLIREGRDPRTVSAAAAVTFEEATASTTRAEPPTGRPATRSGGSARSSSTCSLR